jgi:hypothetical protein
VTTSRQWAELLHAVSRPAPGSDSGALLRQAMGLALDVAPGVVGCSVTEIAGGTYSTPVFSDGRAVGLDLAQYESGDGPCMAAAREQRFEHFDVITDKDRFPGFTEAAIDQGVQSSVSLPLIGTDRPAAINLYASTRSAFDAERPRAVSSLLARCVSSLIAGPTVLSSTDAPAMGSALELARERAGLVNSAQVTVMSRHGVSRSVAFRTLAERSRAECRSIFDISREVIGAAGTEVAP